MYNDHKVKSLHTVLPKTGAYVKLYDRETKWAHFLSEDDDLVEKYNTIWDSQCSYQKNLIAKLSTIKIFWKTKQNLMAMKLQIFIIKNS